MDNETNRYVTNRIIDLLSKSLVLTDDREPIKENWLGELLIKLRIKKRGYKFKTEVPSNKVLRIVKCLRLKLPEE